MSQRNSGMKRRRADLYQTPAWVVLDALAPFLPLQGARVKEPCCGSGFMVRALEAAGATVWPADKLDYRFGRPIHKSATPFEIRDFLDRTRLIKADEAHADIVMNPPYGVQGATALAFIERGLELITDRAVLRRRPSFLAVLLPVDFDSGSTRHNYFGGNSHFWGRISLRRRIVWFKHKGKEPRPSQNHAWFIWRSEPRRLGELPVQLYAPMALCEEAETLPAIAAAWGSDYAREIRAKFPRQMAEIGKQLPRRITLQEARSMM